MEDGIPNHPGRPDHPDFWKLSEIILEMDGKFSEGEGEDFEAFIREQIDVDSVTYMALQRALRLQGRGLDSIAAIYLEAFIVGRTFERRYGSS